MLIPILCFGPMVMATVCYLIGRRSKEMRNHAVGLTGVAVFLGCLLLWRGETTFVWADFCGLGLHMRADGFRSLYATIAAFMWMMTGLFSPDYFAHYHNRNRYYFFNLMTLGATLGVFLSDDLYTTLIFFEVMSLTSYTWVAHEETPAAMKAAGTYLAVAVIGGLTTLMGLFILHHELGTLSFDGIRAALAAREDSSGIITTAAWLTLFGFAAKAGMFPLHIWLPKAHPVAPAPASALLSGILTKSGVFGLLVVATRILPGDAAFGRLLLVFAVITMFLGALLALFSVDLKRTLACSSMSQIGFISVGVAMMVLLGEEGSLAAYGAVLHMVNHSLIKLCLFMCAGVVYMNLHRLNLNDIRGFGRKKPVLHAAFLLGALAIGCIPPLGSGYNSKSLLHEGILEYIAVLGEEGLPTGIYRFVEILFLISGGLTIAYMTKLYVCLFWEKHPTRQAEFDAKKPYMKPVSVVVLLGSAVILPILGLFGAQLMSPLAARSMHFLEQEELAHAIHYFSAENLIGAAQSIGIGAVVYLAVVRPLLMKKENGVRVYVDRWPAGLDLEELVYRPLLLKVLPGVTGVVTAFIAGLPESRLVKVILPAVITGFTRFFAELPERIILLVRGTVFSKRQDAAPVTVGTRFTYSLGRAMDRVALLLNRRLLHRSPLRTDFEYVLDAARQDLTEMLSRATRSVSFGLLLMCIGLYATCLYLLFR